MDPAQLLQPNPNYLRRSHSSPSIFTHTPPSPWAPPQAPKSSIVKQALVGIALYTLISIIIYLSFTSSFNGRHSTHPMVDALYFTAVSLCTVGYGDLVPGTTLSKLFTCALVLVGFGFVNILLNGLLTYVLDRQEAMLLSSLTESNYAVDVRKRRVRVRAKVGLAVGVVAGCVGVGTVAARFLEGLGWVDGFYLTVTSVTTVGYGDYAFGTLEGRLFAVVWLVVSTVCVARAFLFLTEVRMERRSRRVAAWVLRRKMTAGDLVAADLDNDGSLRYENCGLGGSHM